VVEQKLGEGDRHRSKRDDRRKRLTVDRKLLEVMVMKRAQKKGALRSSGGRVAGAPST
jgi:hypothetical protein